MIRKLVEIWRSMDASTGVAVLFIAFWGVAFLALLVSWWLQ